jgi:flagellar motor protein MotB
MASSCKCKKPAECEECPEWIFTFADLVMLMMGFFVILWVLKPEPGKKSEGSDQYVVNMAAAIREAFGYEPNPSSKDPVDMQMIINGLSKVKKDGPGNGGKVNQDPKGPDGSDPNVTSIRPAKQATEGGKMGFAPGSADLTDDCKAQLQQEADQVRGHRNIVMVKGHTSLDDLGPDATDKQKMDLSIRRAQAAADYLISLGVDPHIVRVQGCSTFEPLRKREYSAEAQASNRRIEVEATATLSDEFEPPAPKQPDGNATPATEPGQ